MSDNLASGALTVPNFFATGGASKHSGLRLWEWFQFLEEVALRQDGRLHFPRTLWRVTPISELNFFTTSAR